MVLDYSVMLLNLSSIKINMRGISLLSAHMFGFMVHISAILPYETVRVIS